MSQHTMTRPLNKFWSVLEYSGLDEIPGEWRRKLDDEFPLIARFLLPTQELAEAVGSPVPYRHCVHEVLLWKGRYITICPDGCESVTMSREDLVVHRIDLGSLGREIAAALGLDATPATPVQNIRNVWRIGDYAPSAGFHFPVFLAFLREPYDFDFTVASLAARGRPFILTAPTGSLLTEPAADLLQRTKSCFLPLTKLLGQNNDGHDGRLALLDGHTADALFAELRTAHVPQPKADDGMMFFPTPAGTNWPDVSIQFIDRHSVYVAARGESGKFHCAQMGMASRKDAKPTKQWLLLETFAEGHGLLDWRSRKADNKNQKRKELLAADLQRFFRITTDPFAIEGTGWRTLFTVAVQE